MKERCPELKAVRIGDEACYWCDLSDHPCMVEYGDNECEIYEEYLTSRGFEGGI